MDLIETVRRECLDRTSYSISNIIITSIERAPDAKGTRRQRAETRIAQEQISVVIDGRSIVEVYTKGRLPPESNSPPTASRR